MLKNPLVIDIKTDNALLQDTLEAGKQIVEPQNHKAIMKKKRIESLLSPHQW